MDWETYYNRFYDWADSTRLSRISSLTSFGPSAQIAEIAQELDEKGASRLIRRALDAGVQFTGDEIYDLWDFCDTGTMELLLDRSTCRLSREMLEDLWGIVDDGVLDRAAKRSGVDIWDDIRPEPEEYIAPVRGPGLFTRLLAGIGIAQAVQGMRKGRGGRCNGDCARCPPHYGYRYGRWYYGHGHNYGCELGGNKGGGGED